MTAPLITTALAGPAISAGGDEPDAPESAQAPGRTRAVILEVARRCFAEHGYAGTSLNGIADEVGIRRPSLLHHFHSKEELYRAVLLDSFTDWLALVEVAVVGSRTGWPQVERVISAGFQFFEDHPDFVRLIRREAIEGGPILSHELGRGLRPLFERAVSFFEREMDAGRLRRYDARQLLLTGYGAILSYFSDAPLMGALVDHDPLSAAALAERRRHIIELFGNALDPAFEAAGGRAEESSVPSPMGVDATT